MEENASQRENAWQPATSGDESALQSEQLGSDLPGGDSVGGAESEGGASRVGQKVCRNKNGWYHQTVGRQPVCGRLSQWWVLVLVVKGN